MTSSRPDCPPLASASSSSSSSVCLAVEVTWWIQNQNKLQIRPKPGLGRTLQRGNVATATKITTVVRVDVAVTEV